MSAISAALAALLLVGGVAPITRPTPPAPAELCAYIDSWRGTNVPISPGISATDIVHAVAVANQNESVGWLVTRRDGKVWYFDGPVQGKAPSSNDSVKVLEGLGLASIPHHQGQMIPLKNGVELAPLVSRGLGVYTCY